MHAVIDCLGHPAISGTHAKTFELTLERDISKRATCVVGVAAEVDWRRLLVLRGMVRFDLSVDGHHDAVRAEMNPLFRTGDRLVVRTSRFRGADTLAVGADKASADLDRALVGALALPGSRLHVEVTPERAGSGRAAGVLLVLTGGAGEERPPGAELLARATAVCRLQDDRAGDHEGDPALGAALAGGGLGCAVVDAGPDAATGAVAPARGLDACIALALETGADIVAASGTAALMAVLAAIGPSAEGYLVLDAAAMRPAAQRRALVRSASMSPWPVVWSGPVPSIRRVLEALDPEASKRPACLAADEGEGVVRIRPGRLADLIDQLPAGRGRGEAPVLVGLSGAAGPDTEPRATVRRLLAALAGSGVSARTLHRALDQVPGLEPAWTYDELAALAREAPS